MGLLLFFVPLEMVFLFAAVDNLLLLVFAVFLLPAVVVVFLFNAVDDLTDLPITVGVIVVITSS